MVRCSMQGCTNYQGKKKDGRNVRFFCFPKNEELCKEWLDLCGIDETVNLNVSRICSDHFVESDYKLQHILLNIPENKRKLKLSAVPSVNLPRPQISSEWEEAAQRQLQKELVEEAIFNYNRRYVMEIARDCVEPEVDPETVSNWKDAGVLEDPLAAPGPEACRIARQNRTIQMHIKRLKKRLHLAETAISSIEKLFTKGQFKRIKNPTKRYKWCYEDISYGASLYAAGPTAYSQLVKRGYPLPTPVTLKKWASTLNLKPGIVTSVVQMLSGFKYELEDRLCVLSFHEMTLKSVKQSEATEGEELHKTGQVFVVQGLMRDWKHIIYYNFDCPKAGVPLLEIVHALKVINFTVVAVVSGVGHLKLPLWVEMQIDKDRPYAEVIKGEQIFFFGNVPHLVKNLRNAFVETGFVLNEKCVNIDPLRELLDPSMPDLELDFKLTEAHLSSKKINRLNVKLACELLSNQVANALRRCVSMGKIYSHNAIECSDLIQLISEWIDVFNAKHCTGDACEGALPYGLSLEEQDSTINLMDELIMSLSRVNQRRLLQFEKRILLNNNSLRQLRRYLLERYNITYVVTHRFNQDDLEQALKIRRSNMGVAGQPTFLEFKYRINSAVLVNLDLIKSS